MEGEIKLDIEHKYSEKPNDSGLTRLLENLEKNDNQLGEILKDKVLRNPGLNKIITDTLLLSGRDWFDFPNSKDNPDLVNEFGQILANINTPKEDGSLKGTEEIKEEFENFVKKLP